MGRQIPSKLDAAGVDTPCKCTVSAPLPSAGSRHQEPPNISADTGEISLASFVGAPLARETSQPDGEGARVSARSGLGESSADESQ
eukprot:2400741-Amphidinium_carterae.1